MPQNYPPARCGLSATNFVARRVNYPPFAIFSKKGVKIFGSVFNISLLCSVWHHDIENICHFILKHTKTFHALHYLQQKETCENCCWQKKGETGVLWGCCRISSITYRARLKLLTGNCALQYFSHCPEIFLSQLFNISLITLKYFSYFFEIFYSLFCTISLFVLDYFSHCFRICLSLL